MEILACTPPARGHLYPLVPILDQLAASVTASRYGRSLQKWS